MIEPLNFDEERIHIDVENWLGKPRHESTLTGVRRLGVSIELLMHLIQRSQAHTERRLRYTAVAHRRSRNLVDNRTTAKSVFLIFGVVAILLVAGLAFASSPSDDVTEAARLPTTTTTTEPPPEGVLVITIDNGSFRPSNVLLDLDETWIVKWINEDPREYVLADKGDLFEEILAPGDEYEFDYSTLEPGIYRVFATVGFQRIPGTIDTRPEQ